MLLHAFLAVFLVEPLLAKKQTIKCKSCYRATQDAALNVFNNFDSDSNLEENAENAGCDAENNDKSAKCDKAAGCLMIKNKLNEIVEYGCVKEWDQKKKKAIPIEDSKYNAATKKALTTFDSCKSKARKSKSGLCSNSDFKSFDVSDLLTGPSSSERGDFVNNLVKCGENYCFICDNDDCHYTKEILDADFEQWYEDKQESEKVTTTTSPTTTSTMTLLAKSTTINSTAIVPLASFATLSITLFFL